MKRELKRAEWMEGIVDLDDEHIRITYGDVRKNEEIILFAFVTPTVKGKEDRFTIQFVDLQDIEADRQALILRDVKKDLDYFLVEKGELYPWKYAAYHCSIAANIYSPVHWSYFPKWYIEKMRLEKQS